MRSQFAYGWRPSKPHTAPKLVLEDLTPESDLPKEVDMRATFPPPYDQGQLGSCTANATAGLIQRECLVKNYPWPYQPSRLFIYYNARAIEGSIATDAGAELHDVVQAIANKGVCPEDAPDHKNPGWWWTYSDDQVKFRLPPFQKCYTDAVLHKALTYSNVSLDRLTVLNMLAQDRPFCFGFTVYESFESQDTASTGIMSIPKSTEQVLGGHAVDAVGYLLGKPMGNDGVTDWVIVRNSWADTWGDKGYFYMPLDQILCNAQMASDAWTLDSTGFAK